MIRYEMDAESVRAFDGTKEIGICHFVDEKGIRTIDHTGVDPAYRGQSIAAELVRRCVEDAMEKKLLIDPLCSYAAGQFAKHPEWTLFRKGEAV